MKALLWIFSGLAIVYFLGVLMANYQIDSADKNMPDMIRERGNVWYSWFGYPVLWSRIDEDEKGQKHYYK